MKLLDVFAIFLAGNSQNKYEFFSPNMINFESDFDYFGNIYFFTIAGTFRWINDKNNRLPGGGGVGGGGHIFIVSFVYCVFVFI